MGVMSICDFNKNTSAAFAKVEAGEVIQVTRNGRVIAEVNPPKPRNRMDDPAYRAKYERMLRGLEEGIPGSKGPFSYEERTER